MIFFFTTKQAKKALSAQWIHKIYKYQSAEQITAGLFLSKSNI